MSTAYDCVIEQIVQSVFSTMLGVDAERIDIVAPTEQDSLIATIQIAGAWTGCVVLEMSHGVANSGARTMLKIAEADATDADRQEVAAELVNMVGGNLKSLLPGPSYLSLPNIVSGRELDVRVHDAALAEYVFLMSHVGTISVRLYERNL